MRKEQGKFFVGTPSHNGFKKNGLSSAGQSRDSAGEYGGVASPTFDTFSWGKSKSRKPELIDFGATHATCDQLHAEIEPYKQQEFNKDNWTILTVASIAIVFGTMYSLGASLAMYIVGAFVYVPPLAAFFLFVAKKIHVSRQPKLTPEQAAIYEDLKDRYSRRAKYDAAVKKWHHHNSITSVAFWRNKKGVSLEKSVASLLRERGWNVGLTATTGDGGIDLICEKQDAKVLVQCKGHKNSLGVGAIRDAAGVKLANGGDQMVVIAPNGFTAGSTSFAKQSGVILLDAHGLVSIASRNKDFP